MELFGNDSGSSIRRPLKFFTFLPLKCGTDSDQFSHGTTEIIESAPTGKWKHDNLEIIDLDPGDGDHERESDVERTIVHNQGGIHDDDVHKRKNRDYVWPDEILEKNSKRINASPDEEEIWAMMENLILSDDDGRFQHSGKELNVENASDACNFSAANKGLAIVKQKRRVPRRRVVIDLWSLLLNCARAMTGFNNGSAHSFIEIIRKHSSPLGDGTQKWAHYLADSLEARLYGCGKETYYSLAYNTKSVMDDLNVYSLLSDTTLMNLPMEFMKENIFTFAKKATTIHIIDFGIMHGIHWLPLIKGLSSILAEPPKLRITGIEFPESGFQPTRGTVETGTLLARCCRKFGVMFEYNPVVSRDWGNIKIEDLKLRTGETIVVNSMYRLRFSLDETVMDGDNSSRDAVLRLIREVRPDIFIHCVANGSHNSPFFVSRFNEIMHNYSAAFDMLDTAISNTDDSAKIRFEKEHIGKKLVNAIACEGSWRIERSEGYQEWERRMKSADLQPMLLDKEIISRMEKTLKKRYNQHFQMEEKGYWLLYGWKGQMSGAMSCWCAPTHDF